MDLLTLLLTTVTLLSATVYLLLLRQRNRWSRFGVPCARNTHLLFGNVQGMGHTEHSSGVLQRLYGEFRRCGLRIGGYMNFFFQPAILVLDPNIIKHILLIDFRTFSDRGLYVDPVGDPLSAGLFFLEGAQWHATRAKVTPMFSSSKMKYMFGTVQTVVQRLVDVLLGKCGETIEVKGLLQSFTMDVIGNVAFGIECNTLQSPGSEFSRMGSKALQLDTTRLVKFLIGGQFPGLARWLGMKVMPADVNEFFTELAKGTVKLRERSNVQRNDFLNLLLEARKTEGEAFTMEEITAQCFMFFTAGFESSSTTMTFCLYELAMNVDVQERLQMEIEEMLGAEPLTYEVLAKMDYLDRVISETLRKYPPFDALLRVNSTDYTIPGTSCIIPARTMFQIPIYALHHDPEYYPEPENFNPDRFLPGRVAARKPFVYLPFGDGPRSCIGLRFGLLQTKIGLVSLIRKFRFLPDAQTSRKLTFEPTTLTLDPKGGMHLKVEPI